MKPLQTCLESDLTVVGVCFGIIIEQRTKHCDGTDSPLLHLYIEDDEVWHFKTSFDALWIPDLLKTIITAGDITSNIKK